LEIASRKAAKENSRGPEFYRPWRGFVALAHFLPRLTPWATFIRHSVADGLRALSKI